MLKRGDALRVGIDLSVDIRAADAQSVERELQQILDDLNLADVSIHIAREPV